MTRHFDFRHRTAESINNRRSAMQGEIATAFSSRHFIYSVPMECLRDAMTRRLPPFIYLSGDMPEGTAARSLKPSDTSTLFRR